MFQIKCLCFLTYSPPSILQDPDSTGAAADKEPLSKFLSSNSQVCTTDLLRFIQKFEHFLQRKKAQSKASLRTTQSWPNLTKPQSQKESSFVFKYIKQFLQKLVSFVKYRHLKCEEICIVSEDKKKTGLELLCNLIYLLNCFRIIIQPHRKECFLFLLCKHIWNILFGIHLIEVC